MSKPSAGRPAYGSFINNGRFFKIEDEASGRNGRFYQSEAPIWAAVKQFINGQVKKAPFKASTIASYKVPHKASYTASKASYKASSKASYKEP